MNDFESVFAQNPFKYETKKIQIIYLNLESDSHFLRTLIYKELTVLT